MRLPVVCHHAQRIVGKGAGVLPARAGRSNPAVVFVRDGDEGFLHHVLGELQVMRAEPPGQSREEGSEKHREPIHGRVQFSNK